MGVKGLWRLLLPIGRRISIETLEGKILAIDASIWLTQFLKAMRDPDTGSVRPAAHLIGFFRRLCKLRYHGIRPVLVFDGATPEIKKREIQQRRQRREQLFSSHESNTVQRMAKRILAAELKKKAKKNVVTSGAYAPGFRLAPEEKKDATEQEDAKLPAVTLAEKKNASKEPGVTKETSKDAPTSENVIDLVGEWEEPTQDESANIWGKDEEEASREGGDSDSDYDPSSDGDDNNGGVFDIDRVASMAPHARKDAIEDARRRQRMRSRREFMPVAAQPSEYSQVQLRNFLRSSRLNQQIQKMAVQTSDRNDALGERIASDATRRIIFTKDKPKPANQEHAHRQNEQVSEDEEEFEWQDEEEDTLARATQNGINKKSDNAVGEANGGGFIVESPSSAQNGKEMAQETESNKDSAEEGGGGFLVETESDACALNDGLEMARRAGEESGSLSYSQSARRAQELNDEVLARGIQESELDMTHQVAASKDFDGSSQNEAVNSDAALAAQLQAEESNGQDTTSSLAKEGIEIDSDEEDFEGDVDWEDGDEGGTAGLRESPLKLASSQALQTPARIDEALAAQRQAKEDKRPVATSALNQMVVPRIDTQMRSDSGDSDDDVDWEDGAEAGNDSPPISDEKRANPQHQGVGQAAIGSVSHDGVNAKREPLHYGEASLREQDEEDETQALFEDQSGAAGVENDFEKPLHLDATAAALKHAQATASNLTDWAGRAFRRAIAKHAKETGRSIPGHKSPIREEKEVHGSDADTNTNDAAATKVDGAAAAAVMGDGTPGRASGKPAAKAERMPDTSASIETTAAALTPENGTISKPHFAPMDPLRDPVSSLQEQEELLAEESKRYERDMDTVTDEMKEEVVALLQLFGIPYVEAPAEAESQCAALEELGLVHGIVTEDSDVFVFGGRNVYKNIFDDQKYVEAYLAEDAERDLSLGRNELIALAMLLGGDYTEGVKGVGIVNGMEVLQAFDVSTSVKEGLGKFRQWMDGWYPNPKEAVGLPSKAKGSSSKEQFFHEKHKSARTRWIVPKDFPADNVINAYANPVVDRSQEHFSWGTPDLENLKLFCRRNMGWASQETEGLVSPVIAKIESGSRQTRIESFFMTYEDDIKFAKVQSKRLREVFRGRKNANGGEAESASADDTHVGAFCDDDIERNGKFSGEKPSKRRKKCS